MAAEIAIDVEVSNAGKSIVVALAAPTLTTVAAVHAITSTGTADCIVAALLDDVA